MSEKGSNKGFTIPEIFKLSQKHNQEWGISGYETPAKYLDHVRLAEQKLQFKYVSKELKRPKPGSVNLKAKRGGILEDLKKTEGYKPEPWKYDLRQKWLKGYQGTFIKEKIAQIKQKMKFKWLGTVTEKQELEVFERTQPGKPDFEAKKHTFIDEIILQNTKKEFPLPGPGNYFMDKKGAMRFFAEHEDLVVLKTPGADKTQKDRMPFFKKKRKKRL